MNKGSHELFRLTCAALERAGAHGAMAEAAARHLVAAEEQGLPTHGMSRVPFYCSMLRNGRADGAALTGSAIGPEADSFFSEHGNRPRIGQAFVAIDPAALAGRERYFERVEAVAGRMLADEGVRLPGAKRFAAAQRACAAGIEVADDLLAKIEKLAHG